jgi:hypothetical protein
VISSRGFLLRLTIGEDHMDDRLVLQAFGVVIYSFILHMDSAAGNLGSNFAVLILESAYG